MVEYVGTIGKDVTTQGVNYEPAAKKIATVKYNETNCAYGLYEDIRSGLNYYATCEYFNLRCGHPDQREVLHDDDIDYLKAAGGLMFLNGYLARLCIDIR